jgi:tetratricopeptide (TPR) repeat protein
MCRRAAISGLASTLLLLGQAIPVTASPASAEAIHRGDLAWTRRAEGERGGVPRPEPIQEAIAAYEEALAADPENLEARWRLQRALYFQGEYVATTAEARLAAFARGRELGEQGLDALAAPLGGRERLAELAAAELASRLADRRLAAEIYFWTAAHWGLWGRTRGKLAAAREGVAGTVRDYATAVTALDASAENGGGHRILGRLHFEAPRIPFITGWVSKATAVAELERARAIAPEDLLTQLYLGEALLAADGERRSEALGLLRQVAAATPGEEWRIEDGRAIADARKLLAELDS